jgi:hypothetical protein
LGSRRAKLSLAWVKRILFWQNIFTIDEKRYISRLQAKSREKERKRTRGWEERYAFQKLDSRDGKRW